MIKVPLGTYKHYKGGLYNVIGTCADITPTIGDTIRSNIIRSDTIKNLFVLYQSKNEKLYWLRPVEMFTNYAEPGVPRFKQISNVVDLPSRNNLLAFHTEEEIYYQVHFDMNVLYSWFCYKI